MTLRAPESLGSGHVIERFDCARESLNTWLLRHARLAQSAGSAKTFVVADDAEVVGYYSLTVGQVSALDAPERLRKGMGAYPIPVVLLARLAVSRSHQGNGIGVGMLKDAMRRALLISEQAGVRAMLTHLIDDQAASFYRRYGFVASPVQESQLLLLLKDVRAFRHDMS